ncbi:MAG: TIGR00300 family protein [Nitrospinota bacterium]|nr:TIGR00300 family protein [Nitrospinota bacterium]
MTASKMPLSLERFFMCLPDHFNVEYVINPWMEGNIGKADPAKAMDQWAMLHQLISDRAQVELIKSAPGLPDMVFTANAGLILGQDVILSHFAHPERQAEEPLFRKWFEDHGYKVINVPDGIFFEGAGDALFDGSGSRLWAAYGNRTSLFSHPFLADTFNIEVVSLRLVDPRFYHLDTCFLPLPDGAVAWYPGAFDTRSNRIIESLVPENMRINVGEDDAPRFSANAVVAGDVVIMNCASEKLSRAIRNHGLKVEVVDFSEFIKAGGSAKCLTLRLDQPAAEYRTGASQVVSRVAQIEGQLIDSALLSMICDTVADSGGAFHVRDMRLGNKRYEHSSVMMDVAAPGEAELDAIMQSIIKLGARLPSGEVVDARLAPAPRDGVAPENFYSTTIYPTQVRAAAKWLEVVDQRMDGIILVKDGAAKCLLIRDLAKGDLVVTGGDGIRAVAPMAHRWTDGGFEFMTSAVSSERRVEGAVEKVAWEMNRIKRRGGRIVVVAGPVVIHTGGAEGMAWLAATGYISALLGGNAIAAHDVEQAIFGTSLGVDIKTGQVTQGGHRNHLAAINRVRLAGSIREAVGSGIITSGLFRELVLRDIPFSLAGSIRDDGPLPETQMDLIKAQSDYSRLIKGADMILALSTMLHSIGVGNMTPSGVKFVCVDINPAVAPKLLDRGSLESIGVVTDAGLFMALLVAKLKEMEG